MIKITKQYIAGLFDGEGSIGIYNRKDRYNGVCLRTQLTQNKTKESFLILNFLKDKYGGNLSEQKTLSDGIKYNWQLNPKGVEKFLKDIKPYLVLKNTQAQLALFWLKNRPKVKRDKRGKVLSFKGNEIEFTRKIVMAMKALKKEDIDIVMKNQEDLVEVLVELTPLAVIKG
jgi:hypothetical protein